MEQKIQNIEAYHDNEADANKQMSYSNAVAAGFSLLLFIAYLTGFFTIPKEFLPVVLILFPISTVVLLIPLFLTKTELIRKK